ncbi:MAG TPA: hypothetical protein VFU47_05525 [Armatimonadota bacterium]|nr:hypothetical protein [Armatimonadota bacterium]
MSEGIQINDAAVAISPAGLEALLRKQGAALTVTRLDLSVSPEALNTLLRGLGSPPVEAGAAEARSVSPPSLSGLVEEGRLQLTVGRDGQNLDLDLQMAGLRLDFTAGGLRLTSG